MHRILLDVRFALRLLVRSPGFAASMLAILVLGIGATTAMFSIVECLLVRPLPYPHPEELTMIWCTQPLVNPSPASIPDFLDWKARATTFQQMSATNYGSYSLASDGAPPEHLSGADVSGDFFPLLGVHPLVGRLLGPDDDRVGAPPVAVLSASVWHRRFGSDPHLVGSVVRLNSEPYTVVGVAPEGFRFSGPRSDRADVWTPLAPAPRGYEGTDGAERGSHFVHVIGRRKPGVTLAQAQAELSAIAKNVEAAHPDTNTRVGVRLLDLHEALIGSSRAGVWVLFAAVALVFLVVCANVANLLLTRAAARRSEMAVRAALGGTRRRLASQLVTETVVVFSLGALGGALLARWLVGLFAPGVIHGAGAFTIDIHVDLVALLFCVGTSLVCGLLFGLVPAWEASRVEPQAVLKETSTRAGTSRSQRIVRSALVVAQVALAFALLAGGGLALRAFAKTATTPPGFDPRDLVTARVVLPEPRYADPVKVRTFYRDLLERLSSVPGVQRAAANGCLPMAGWNSNGSFAIEGRPPWPHGEEPLLERNVVTPGYFETMGVPLLRGRAFTDADTEDSRHVMVLSKAAADRFFPGADPVGQRIDWEDENGPEHHEWREIVGVVGDVRRLTLADPVAAESYVPLAQHSYRSMVLVARSPRADAVAHELARLVASLDPELAIERPKMMEARVADSIGPQRFVTVLLASFAAAALLLATVGIFGLVSYSTTQKTRELGIRMALGASPDAVLALVMRDGARLVGAGLVVGAVGALLVGRALAGRMPGVVAFDPGVFAVIGAALAGSGLVATLLPAWRAVRIPPAIALRYE